MTGSKCWQCKSAVFVHEAYPNGECAQRKRDVIYKSTDACKHFVSRFENQEGVTDNGKDE